MNYASIALDQMLALYILAGWTPLWRSTGPCHDAYMSGVTDGVTFRIIGSAGYPEHEGVVFEETVTVWDPEERRSRPVYGPARPRPGSYPTSELLDMFGCDADSLPASVHYAPWAQVFNLGEKLAGGIEVTP